MPKPSAISVFVAATSLLVASAPALRAEDVGGLKEWTTDQGVDEGLCEQESGGVKPGVIDLANVYLSENC